MIAPESPAAELAAELERTGGVVLAMFAMRRAAWLGGPSLRRRFCAGLGQAQALRPFLVEQYRGWTDPGVEFPSLSSSECEPLSLRQLLALADDRSLRQWESLSLGYPAFNQGSLWLREEIASLYASDDLGPAQVNVCVPQEGIYLAMRALLSPGAHVVVTSPCYQSLYEVARAMGCELSHWR